MGDEANGVRALGLEPGVQEPGVQGAVVEFARRLRSEGAAVPPDRVITALEALRHVGVHDRAAFRSALRATLVFRAEDLGTFDDLFRRYWLEERRASLPADDAPSLRSPTRRAGSPAPDRAARRGPTPAGAPDPAPNPAPASTQGGSSSSRDARRAVERAIAASPAAAAAHKRFEDCSPAELWLLEALLERGVPPLPTLVTRRLRAKRGAGTLDLRGTIRAAARTGGEALELRRRSPRRVARPLVVLLDVSGSMRAYARPLLVFLHALSRSRPLEAFAFGTDVARITRPLRARDLDAALRAVHDVTHGEGGGTRIGESVRAYRRAWGARTLRGGAVVAIASDGWDGGPPEALEREMRALTRRAHRVAWLNPLLGIPGYEPLTRSLQTALPHVDAHLDAGSAEALLRLAHDLRELELP